MKQYPNKVTKKISGTKNTEFKGNFSIKIRQGENPSLFLDCSANIRIVNEASLNLLTCFMVLLAISFQNQTQLLLLLNRR